jgi:hypothetical protein
MQQLMEDSSYPSRSGYGDGHNPVLLGLGLVSMTDLPSPNFPEVLIRLSYCTMLVCLLVIVIMAAWWEGGGGEVERSDWDPGR